MKRIDTDIVIVGGGVAGIAAALGASEEGKKVVVIERASQLGGNAIQSNVGTICGAYYNNHSVKPQHIDHPMINKVLGALGNEPIDYHGLFVVPYEVEKFYKFLISSLQNENTELLLDASIDSIDVMNSVIQNLNLQISDAKFIVETKAIVDSSGNGIISELAGLEMLRSDSYQAASQVFQLGNVNTDNDYSLNFAIRKAMVRIVQQKELAQELVSLSTVPGSLKDGTVDLKFTLPAKITDDTRQEDLNLMGKEYVEDLYAILKSDVDSLRESVINKIYPHAGIRVLQRSKGKYILTEEDVLDGLKCEGAKAAIGTWPIEEWDNKGKVHLKPLPDNDFYEIPTECLMSYRISNLFLAGKNISATEKAIGSARVIGTCLQTGYSAGKMASSFI